MHSSEVDLVVDILATKMTTGYTEQAKHTTDEFSCSYCYDLMYEPVTLQCGHSICKDCHDYASQCNNCGAKSSNESPLCINVSLKSILQKCHSREYIGRLLVSEGDKLLREKFVLDAICKYSEAIRLAPGSHTAYNSRAKAYAAAGDLESALKDVEQIFAIEKKWPEAYLTKGDILQQLGNEKEAFVNFMMCLSLNPSIPNVRSKTRGIATKFIHYDIENQSLTKTWNGRVYIYGSPMETRNNSNVAAKKMESAKEAVCHTAANYLNDHFALGDQCHNIAATSANENSGNSFCSSVNDAGAQTNGHNVRCKGEERNCMSSLDERESEYYVNAILSGQESPSLQELNTMSDAIHLRKGLSNPFHRECDPSLVNRNDFECSICKNIYLIPVTTTCGHTFCRDCLERSMDFCAKCPLCNCVEALVRNKSSFTRSNMDCTTDLLLKEFLPGEYSKRMRQFQDIALDIQQSLPVFVCATSYPSVACPLHIFEPRYRLLLRRAMDFHNNEFGMCASSNTKQFHDVGTTLHIENVSFLPDGRLIVQTVGSRRFRVARHGTRDGYNTAQVKYIVDTPVKDEARLQTLRKLSTTVYAKAKAWYSRLERRFQDSLQEYYRTFPDKDDSMGDNGPDWAWWLLAVLPVEEKIKLSLLEKTDLQERLVILHRILQCLSSTLP